MSSLETEPRFGIIEYSLIYANTYSGNNIKSIPLKSFLLRNVFCYNFKNMCVKLSRYCKYNQKYCDVKILPKMSEAV